MTASLGHDTNRASIYKSNKYEEQCVNGREPGRAPDAAVREWQGELKVSGVALHVYLTYRNKGIIVCETVVVTAEKNPYSRAEGRMMDEQVAATKAQLLE